MTATPETLPALQVPIVAPAGESFEEALLRAKILIVDDKPANVLLLEGVLGGAGYTCLTSTLDSREVCALHAKECFDLILLDLRMPEMDGFAVMEGLKEIEKDGYLPVLVVTAQPDQKLRALRAGAKDFIGKPFDVAEVLTRVHNMLEVRLLHRAIRRKNVELKRLFDEVVAERKVSERLALHVPADSIAARLKARPDVTPESFDDVTVLIADVVGFADLAASERPERLAELLEKVFATFDELVTQREMRKIKTLGNSYMAASGLPLPVGDHAGQAAQLAFDMVTAVSRLNDRGGYSLQLRVGIASGAVVAAVIGKRMYVYDIWGAAVNDASLMESHGVAGRILVSDGTRGLLDTTFILEPREPVESGEAPPTKSWFLMARRGGAA